MALPQYESNSMSERNHLNVAVVGCGRWGRNIIRTLHELAATYPITLSGIAHTGNERNQRNVKELCGLDCISDFTRILDDSDMVFIASPDDTHFELAKKTISAGIATFVEKPVAQTLRETRELLRLAEENNVLFTTGHIMVFHPCVESIRRTLEERGESVRAIYSSRMDAFPLVSGKTVLRSSLVHDVSIVDVFLANLPMSAHSQCFFRPLPDPEHLDIHLEYPGGIPVHLAGSSIWPIRRRDFVLWSERRVYYFDGLTNRYQVYRGGVNAAGQFELESDEEPEGSPLTSQIEHFLQAELEDNRQPELRVDGKHILRVVETVDLIEQASHGLGNARAASNE